MNYADLIRLYFDRSNSLQWYWTIYVVVIRGLLAFSSLRKQPDLVTAGLVTVLYCFFAYKNLGAIHHLTMQRLAVLELVKEAHPAATEASELARLRGSLEP